ncbi:MAG: hypothetical protein IS860_10680 [Nitrosopumilus sp.]|nr:hypothetical protein [Nitrosopumilus sp.]
MNAQISFQDFCKLKFITYCSKQLRGNKRKNIRISCITSTRKNYLYRLWNFHYWLIGKKFSYEFLIPQDKQIFKKYSKTITLQGLEHFLEEYSNAKVSKVFFSKLIKEYLLDPIHKHKKPQSVSIDYYAIKAYFDTNNHPLNFKYNIKTRHNVEEEEQEGELLTLNDLFKILTIGQPTVMQKAVFLCKFHRGLDTSTFVDRFNFEAWNQIVEIFGTDEHDKWNLKLCPIPIRLTRIKTGIKHVGFLDVDSINALRDYLNYRRLKMNREIQENEVIFISHLKKPITEDWIRRSFRKLIRNVGLGHILKNRKKKLVSNISSDSKLYT